MFASPDTDKLPKSDGAVVGVVDVPKIEVGAVVAATGDVRVDATCTDGDCVPKTDDCVDESADPNAELPKIEEVSVFTADPKMLAGGDCATAFTSGEQRLRPWRIESLLVMEVDDGTLLRVFASSD